MKNNSSLKLIAAGGALLLALATSGHLAYRAVCQVKVGGPIYDEIVQSKDLVADILPPPEYTIESYLTLLELTQESDPAARDELLARLKKLAANYNERHDYWAANLPQGKTSESLLNDAHKHALVFFNVIDSQFVPAIKANDMTAATKLIRGPIKDAYEQHRKAIDVTVESATADAKLTEVRAASVDRQSGYAFSTLATVLVVAMVVVGYLVLRQLRVGRKIQELSVKLLSSSTFIANASTQVSASSQSLAQGASEQAASLEETSSTLEEVASMTKRNADTAQQATALSTEAKQVSDLGNAAMQRMSVAIGEIQKSASQTAMIVKTIDEIAFQTNLLALNAAVEAARAGDAGKGFAVVAEEVRNLAIRSADAAKQTAELIEGSVQNARNGVVIASEVQTSLHEIAGVTGKVQTLISEIATACHEQSVGVGQVNEAVQQMDKVTQSNAAAAEESAAAAAELSTQGDELQVVVTGLMQIVQGAAKSSLATLPPDESSNPHPRPLADQPYRPLAA